MLVFVIILNLINQKIINWLSTSFQFQNKLHFTFSMFAESRTIWEECVLMANVKTVLSEPNLSNKSFYRNETPGAKVAKIV